MIEPTSLTALKTAAALRALPNGFAVLVDPNWIIMGEARLSYSTIISLIECCREHHWQTDLLQLPEARAFDSICRTLQCDFLRPIHPNTEVAITYGVTAVGTRSYTLRFHVVAAGTLCTTCTMVCVFYDPATEQAVTVSAQLKELLQGLIDRGRSLTDA